MLKALNSHCVSNGLRTRAVSLKFLYGDLHKTDFLGNTVFIHETWNKKIRHIIRTVVFSIRGGWS